MPQAAGHSHKSLSDPTGDGGSQPLSQTPDAQEGGGGSTAAGADAPAAPVPQQTRTEKIRAAQNANIARPDTASSAVRETRQDTALREYEEYRKEAALPDTDSTFTALETGSRGQWVGSTSRGTLSFLPAGRMLAW